MHASSQEEKVHITLFSKPNQECYVENFLGETLSYAIIDSGCTKRVCGKLWLQCYLDALSGSAQEQESSSKFKFGDSIVKKVVIPADIKVTKVQI